ncbi:HalX domain-containing protein [Halorubraceae archaeon YAN]|nr:HalX domain-containing protein [Halorubraceae archaeon YAN]
MTEEPPVVLIVEDEPDLADLYAAWLQTDYQVRTAYGGREALDEIDSELDIVLLDRRMPGLSGDEVLVALRERGIDCRVAMVTAVEPDFDIIAMGFDDYLIKPVTKDALKKTVSNLLFRNTYDKGVQELFSLSSKKALLEAEKGNSALEANEEYQELTARIEELRDELDRSIGEVSEHDEFVNMFRSIEADADTDAAAEFDDSDPFGGTQ